MKLGIVVVYLLSVENAPLLDLHLKQIERCTLVPYTIYGMALRLDPALLQRLLAHPHVEICACPPTDLMTGFEHAHYLQCLVERALKDGCSHVVTLHVDSFPLQRGWAQTLADKLNSEQPLAVVSPGQYTACLFFRREFYEQHRPALRLTEEQKASMLHQAPGRKFKLNDESGAGYLFAAYEAGLSWHALRDTRRAASPDNTFSVFDEMIFHLGGVNRRQVGARQHRPVGAESLPHRMMTPLLRTAWRLSRIALTPAVRHALWRAVGPRQQHRILDPVIEPVTERTKQELLNDPDAFLSALLLDDG